MSEQNLDAKIVPQKALPVIDISALRSDAAEDRQAVGRALLGACLDKGFFYIQGHAVPDALRRSVFRQSKAFFALPEAEKNAINLSHSICNRGYEPLRAQTLEIGQPPDLKEGFYSGPEISLDNPRVLAGKFNHGPNQWPATLPGFRPVMEDYHRVMVALGRLVMGGIALALDLDDDAFAGFCQDELATLRLLHYPPQPANPEPGEKGCGAHTDFGTLTFLAQDDCGGLQVWDEEAGWIHAEPVADTYVVNLGDMMAAGPTAASARPCTGWSMFRGGNAIRFRFSIWEIRIIRSAASAPVCPMARRPAIVPPPWKPIIRPCIRRPIPKKP